MKDDASPALRGVFHMTGSARRPGPIWLKPSSMRPRREAGDRPRQAHCDRRLPNACPKAGEFPPRQRKACSRIRRQAAGMAPVGGGPPSVMIASRGRTIASQAGDARGSDDPGGDVIVLGRPSSISALLGRSQRELRLHAAKSACDRRRGIIGSAVCRAWWPRAPPCSTSTRSPTPATCDPWR